jgi:hypothetical protein
MYHKRNNQENFKSKFIEENEIFKNNYISLDLTYQNPNSHIHSNGKTSLGKLIEYRRS